MWEILNLDQCLVIMKTELGDGDDRDAEVIEPSAQIVLDPRHGDEAG